MGAEKGEKTGYARQGTDMNRWVLTQPRLLGTSFGVSHRVGCRHASNQKSRQSENPFSLDERNQMKARLALMIAIAFSLSACTDWGRLPEPSAMMQNSTLQANA
jgi:hypothetical protein